MKPQIDETAQQQYEHNNREEVTLMHILPRMANTQTMCYWSKMDSFNIEQC
ncbi:MAG: hypothetical protein ACK5C0_00925 [Candidatus Kapaibacterium sp.]|jgi:hypothetical protein